MQILELEKVRIMRFSGRKGELEGVLSGSDPDARDKEERQMGTIGSRNDARKVHRGRRRKGGEKRADDTIVL